MFSLPKTKSPNFSSAKRDAEKVGAEDGPGVLGAGVLGRKVYYRIAGCSSPPFFHRNLILADQVQISRVDSIEWVKSFVPRGGGCTGHDKSPREVEEGARVHGDVFSSKERLAEFD